MYHFDDHVFSQTLSVIITLNLYFQKNPFTHGLIFLFDNGEISDLLAFSEKTIIKYRKTTAALHQILSRHYNEIDKSSREMVKPRGLQRMTDTPHKISPYDQQSLQNVIPTQITNEQFHILLDNMQIMAVILDTKGCVVYSNPFFQNVLGIGPDEVVGKEWFPTSLVEHKDRQLNPGFSATNGNKITSSYIQKYLPESGLNRTIEWNNTAIWNQKGEFEFVVCLGKDITEHNKNDIEHSRVLETLEKHVADRTVELEALYAVASIANEVLELPMMLEKMLVQTLRVIRVANGTIHLLDKDGEELHLAAQIGISPEITKKISSITTGFGLTGWVAQQKQPLTLMNVSNDPRILAIGQVSGFSVYLSAPLISQNNLMGVISIFGDTTQQLNPERIALLTTIADQIGIAVERTKLRAQAEQSAILEERQRVARELHDSVTQSLYSLTLLAAAAQRSAHDGNMERTLRNIDSIGMIALQTLKEMRLLVYELQPSTLESGGLAEAIQRRLDAVEEHAGMQTKFINESHQPISKQVEIELYGLTQEALNNSIKHGGATTITVRLSEKDDSILLDIIDNGKGFDLKQAESKHGTGLISMNKRVDILGGRIEISTEPGEGTRIQVSVPIKVDKTGSKIANTEESHD